MPAPSPTPSPSVLSAPTIASSAAITPPVVPPSSLAGSVIPIQFPPSGKKPAPPPPPRTTSAGSIGHTTMPVIAPQPAPRTYPPPEVEEVKVRQTRHDVMAAQRRLQCFAMQAMATAIEQASRMINGPLTLHCATCSKVLRRFIGLLEPVVYRRSCTYICDVQGYSDGGRTWRKKSSVCPKEPKRNE